MRQGRSSEHYASLGKPLDPAAFVAELESEMRRELTALDDQLPKMAWVDIAERNAGAIRLTPLDAVPEPRNLRRLKAEVTRRWGVAHPLDILKEADLRIGFTGEFTPVGTRVRLSTETSSSSGCRWPSTRMGPTPVCAGSPRVSTATARTTCATPAAAT